MDRDSEGDPRETTSEESEERIGDEDLGDDLRDNGSYQDPGEGAAPLTEDELARYGAFRTAGFNKGGIRKFVNGILGQNCNPNFAIVLSGIAKVFTSELVEEAKQVQVDWGDEGELLPSHAHEAYRRLCHRMPNMSINKY